jgi:hypothetical protein
MTRVLGLAPPVGGMLMQMDLHKRGNPHTTAAYDTNDL